MKLLLAVLVLAIVACGSKGGGSSAPAAEQSGNGCYEVFQPFGWVTAQFGVQAASLFTYEQCPNNMQYATDQGGNVFSHAGAPGQ